MEWKKYLLPLAILNSKMSIEVKLFGFTIIYLKKN